MPFIQLSASDDSQVGEGDEVGVNDHDEHVTSHLYGGEEEGKGQVEGKGKVEAMQKEHTHAGQNITYIDERIN